MKNLFSQSRKIQSTRFCFLEKKKEIVPMNVQRIIDQSGIGEICGDCTRLTISGIKKAIEMIDGVFLDEKGVIQGCRDECGDCGNKGELPPRT